MELCSKRRQAVGSAQVVSCCVFKIQNISNYSSIETIQICLTIRPIQLSSLSIEKAQLNTKNVIANPRAENN